MNGFHRVFRLEFITEKQELQALFFDRFQSWIRITDGLVELSVFNPCTATIVLMTTGIFEHLRLLV